MREEERDIFIFENEVQVDTLDFFSLLVLTSTKLLSSQLLLNLLFYADVLSTTSFCLMMILG